MEIVAKTFAGLEELLAQEIKEAGGVEIKSIKRGVKFEANEEVLYRCLLSLRTVLRLLVPVFKFKAHTEKDLYFKVKKLSWEEYIDLNQTFAIDCVANSKVFNHSKFVSLRVKDAICDRFRANNNDKRPDVNVRNPDVPINVHVNNLDVTILLDVSGFSLHQRGYRTSDHRAPLNEALAAGVLMLSGWDKKTDLYDPMCGSGSILIEAAMIACNIPPNLMRNEFGFEKWKDWDVDLYEKIEDSLLSKTKDFHYKISGFDKSPSAVKKAIENIKNANLEEFIKIKHEDFFKTQKGIDNELMIVFNPPYGERLDLDFKSFYKNIGNTFKHKYSGSTAWFITSNLEALKHVGLRPSRKIKLFNAKLESRFVKYDIYQGTRKIHKQKK